MCNSEVFPAFLPNIANITILSDRNPIALILECLLHYILWPALADVGHMHAQGENTPTEAIPFPVDTCR